MPLSSTSPSKLQTDLAAQEKPRRRSSFDNFFDIEIEMRRENDPQAALMANPVISKAFLAVPLAAIVERSRLQTRPPFDPVGDAEDAALVESLKVRGQDTPVILEIIADRQLPEYRIKDGHRRIDALRHIGAQRVDAIVVQSGTPQSDLITLTGNVRKNFSPMEWAHALERLLQDGQSLADIARATGLVHQRLSEWKQLLDLAPEIQAALEQGRITLQAALALGKAPLALQSQLARVANQSDLTETKARQLAERVRDSLAARRMGPQRWRSPRSLPSWG
jgi:ParB/RepB/Spo0J family partition protein